MEMASFLAAEQWSDHPVCTHPLLAELARLVNDAVSHRLRPRLVPLIPSVIGLTSDDVHMDATIALRAAVVALPTAAAHRQRVLVTGVLACEQVLDGRIPGSLSLQSRRVLDQVPQAAAWACYFSRQQRVSPWDFRGQVAQHVLSVAVGSIAQTCPHDAGQMLVDLLADTIADCKALVTLPAASKDQALTTLA